MPSPDFEQADHFLVPLLDGGFGLGQVLYPGVPVEHPDLWAAPLCILTTRRMQRETPCSPISASEVLSVELLAPGPLRDETWPIIGFEQLPPLRHADELRRLEARDGGTAAMQETGLIEAFLNACHGLYPWDGFGSPAIFDALLRPGVARPV